MTETSFAYGSTQTAGRGSKSVPLHCLHRGEDPFRAGHETDAAGNFAGVATSATTDTAVFVPPLPKIR